LLLRSSKLTPSWVGLRGTEQKKVFFFFFSKKEGLSGYRGM
jgi:hypothetical protein